MANIYEEGQDYLASLLPSPVPQTTTDKLNNLAKTQQDKITTLAGAQKVLLRGLNDADTPVDVNGIDYRLQGAQGQSYDAVETRHGNKPIDMYGGTGPYQKSPKAMDAQRTLVAKMVGKPESALTEQDFIDVGNWQTVQAAADVINGPGVWQAPFGQGTAPIDLSGKQESLNIPATVKTTGKDRYGRTLSTLGTAEGIDVTTPAAYDPQRNAAYKYIQQPVGSNADREYAAKFADELSRDNTVLGRAWNTTKAVGAGAANSVYDLIDAGAELLGSDLGTDEEKTAQVNQLFGYDPRYSQEASDSIKSKIQDMQKNGVTTGKVLSMLWEGVKTPEFMGESFGYLIPMLVGGPETALGKAVTTASKGVKAAKTAEELAVATEKLNEAKNAYTNTAKALDFVSKQAGLIGTSIGGTNDDLDEYAKNAGISKGDISAGKIAGAFAGQVVLNALDRFTDISVLKSPEMVAGLRATIKGMTNVQLKELGKGMAGIVAGIAVEGGKEAATEYAQEFIQEIGQQVGDQSGKTIADAWNNEDNKLNRLTNAALGFTGAQQFQGAGVAKVALTEGVGATVKETTGMLNSIADKAEQRKKDKLAEVHAGNAQVDAETLKEKFNIKTPEDKAKFVNTYDIHALPENSTEESEVRNLATETLKGNDNGNILGADIDDVERAKRLKNAVIAADNSIVANRDNVIDTMVNKYNMNAQDAAAVFESGLAVRNAVYTLGEKSTSKVQNEISDGARGFNTYYKNIKAAIANGDSAVEQSNLTSLEYLLGKQENKVRLINATEQKMSTAILSKVAAIVKASNGKISENEAINTVFKSFGDKKETVNYGTGNFNILYRQVAEKLRLPENQQESFTGGGYTAIQNMRNELEAMKTLHADITSSLDSTTSSQALSTPKPVEQTGAQKAIAWTQAKKDSGMTKQEYVNSINASDKITPEVKQQWLRVGEYVYGPDEQVVEQPAIQEPIVEQVSNTPEVNEPIAEQQVQTQAAEEDVFAAFNNPEFAQAVEAADKATESINYDELEKTFATAEAGMSKKKLTKKFVDSNTIFYPDITINAEAKGVNSEFKNLITAYDKALANGTDADITKIEKQLSDIREKKSELLAGTQALIDSILDVSSINLFSLGNGKDIPNILQVSNVTGLSGKTVVADKTLINEISKIVDSLGGITTTGKGKISPSGSSTTLTGNTSPYLTLLYKIVDGKLEFNDNVVIAIDAAMNKYLADNASMLMAPKTIEEITTMIPGLSTEEFDLEDNVLLTQGGNLMKFVANEMGAHVAKFLGIRPGDVSNAATYEAFISGLGYITLRLAESRKLTTISTIRTRSASVPVVTVNGSETMSKMPELRARSKELATKLLYDETDVRGPIYVKPSIDRYVGIHHQPYANATKTQVDAIQTLEQTSFQINEGIDVLTELFKKNGELDTALLAKYIGYEDVSTRTDISKSTKLSKEGANLAYMTAVGSLVGAVENFGKDTKMFFNWFLTKGGRFNLDSTTLNPQTEKHLHRWLVTAENAKTIVNKQEIADMLSGEKLTERAVAFAYGVGQAFGVKIDKIGQDDVLKEVRKLIAMGKDKLVEKVQDDLAKKADAYEHLGQVAVAIAAIGNYETAKDSFVTNLAVEFDGLTNGFSFKVMQYPLEDYKTWLPKIGVLLEGMYPEHGSMNGVKGTKTMYDVYETIALKFKQWNPRDIKRLTELTRPADEYTPAVLTVRQAELAKHAASKLARIGMLEKLKITEGVVDKSIRDLMKDPTMIFNYGAGIVKIRENVALGLVYSNVDKLLAVDENNQYVISDAQIEDLFKVQEGMAEAIRANLRVNELTHKSNKLVYDTLMATYLASYGVPVGEALERTFGGYIKLTQTINKAFDAMYQVFDNNVHKIAAEMYKKGDLTGNYLRTTQKKENLRELRLETLNRRDAVKVIRRMVELGLAPAVQSPDGARAIEKLVVFSRKTADAVFAAAGQEGKTFDAKIEVDKSLEAKAMYMTLVTNIVGEPKAAGGVLLTHLKDGLAMGQTISNYQFLGVHDAEVLGLDQMAAVNDYNKNWYELNKRYSDMTNLRNMLMAVPAKYRNKAFDKIVKSIESYERGISTRRTELYGLNARIGQMVGIDGSVCEVNIEKKQGVTNKVEEFINEKPAEQTEEIGEETTVESTEAQYAYDVAKREFDYVKSEQGMQEIKSDITEDENPDLVYARRLREASRDLARAELELQEEFSRTEFVNEADKTLASINADAARITLDNLKDC